MQLEQAMLHHQNMRHLFFLLYIAQRLLNLVLA